MMKKLSNAWFQFLYHKKLSLRRLSASLWGLILTRKWFYSQKLPVASPLVQLPFSSGFCLGFAPGAHKITAGKTHLTDVGENHSRSHFVAATFGSPRLALPLTRVQNLAAPPVSIRETGSILIATLWILVILVIFALGLGRNVSSQIVFATHLRDRTYSLHLAKAAVRWAVWEIANDETPDFDGLYELRRVREKEFGDKKFRYYFIDEESKINVNTALPKIYDGLPDVTSEIAKSITANKYRPFQLKEELLFVEGMDPEIYAGIKDLVTVYGGGKVNFNTASREVFEVLELGDDLIEMILAYRAGADGEEATEDDLLFENVTSIRADLEEYGILSNAQTIRFVEILTQGLAGVKSDYFKVVVETEVLGRPGKRVVAVIERDTGQIKYWHEE